jgi:UDP-N-acetylmuramyl pentapeptide phosphotransferase/UDP-N-acetylglucosamine-1-phosphate transferase
LATLTHAHNIVDGLNGLSSGSAIFAFLAVLYLALQGDDFELVYFGMMLISITLAFLIFNYPIAKIFLGDGGAYWMGSSIAILSLLLLTRNPSISICTILLINPINNRFSTASR